MSTGAKERRRPAEEEDLNAVERVYRTVTPPYHGRPDFEMTVIGTAYFLGLVILLIPFLPIIVGVWAVARIMSAVKRRRAES